MIVNRLRRALERIVYKVNTHPVIVLGNQKTGTSAIAHLLADYCNLSKTIDISELWAPTIVHLLQDKIELSTIVRKHPKPFSRDLIKEPNMTFIYDRLRCVSPCAQYIFVNRDSRDNIRSFLNRMGIPGNLQHLEVSDWDIPELWKPALYPKIWQIQYTHYIDILAARWNRAADVYLENRNEMVLVRYEDFVADKVGTIESLAQQLGLPQVNDISDKVDIQYQPRGKDRNVPWEDFFGQENLMRIERICGSRMQKFGYSCSLERTKSEKEKSEDDNSWNN